MSAKQLRAPSASIEWATPEWLFRFFATHYAFTVDVCASKHNAKCQRYHSLASSGLLHSWYGETVWMNPPYGRGILHWLEKMAAEPDRGVGLYPARTDTIWWHDFVLRPLAVVEICYIEGRLVHLKGAKLTKEHPALFPSAVVFYDNVSPRPYTQRFPRMSTLNARTREWRRE